MLKAILHRQQLRKGKANIGLLFHGLPLLALAPCKRLDQVSSKLDYQKNDQMTVLVCKDDRDAGKASERS